MYYLSETQLDRNRTDDWHKSMKTTFSLDMSVSQSNRN